MLTSILLAVAVVGEHAKPKLLGQIAESWEPCAIFSKPDFQSPAQGKMLGKFQIVLVPTAPKGDFAPILLGDGSSGWVLRKDIELWPIMLWQKKGEQYEVLTSKDISMVPIGKLNAEFKRHAVNAADKYKGKVIRVSGVVLRIEDEPDNQSLLTIVDERQSPLYVIVPESRRATAKGLGIGSSFEGLVKIMSATGGQIQCILRYPCTNLRP